MSSQADAISILFKGPDEHGLASGLTRNLTMTTEDDDGMTRVREKNYAAGCFFRRDGQIV